MSIRRPVRSSELSPLVIVLWLTSAAIVGVVGCLVLSRAGVGQLLPLSWYPWDLAMVLIGEILLYLVVLVTGGRGRIPGGRVVLGIGLGLIIRASLSLIVVELAFPPGARDFAGFFLYYVQYWVGALVQIFAVSVFLWFIRDAWQVSGTEVVVVGGQEGMADREALADRQARREELLAALMEGPEEEEAKPSEPVAEQVPIPAAQKGEQLALLREEADAQQIEPLTVAEEEDTSRIPAVPEEAEALPAEQWRQLSAAEELLREAGGPGAVADTLSLPRGGGLVWAAPQALEGAALTGPIGRLIDSAQLFGEVAQRGVVQLVVVQGEGGCWVFGLIEGAPLGWWVALAQPAPVTAATALLALRRVQADWPAVDLTGSRTRRPQSSAIVSRDAEYTGPAALIQLAQQWSAQVASVTAAEQSAIVVGPPIPSIEDVAGAGLQMWQAATDLSELLDWNEPASVLAALAEGGLALGWPAMGGKRPLLIVINRDSSQIAAAALRLDRLREQFAGANRTDNLPNNASDA